MELKERKGLKMGHPLPQQTHIHKPWHSAPCPGLYGKFPSHQKKKSLTFGVIYAVVSSEKFFAPSEDLKALCLSKNTIFLLLLETTVLARGRFSFLHTCCFLWKNLLPWAKKAEESHTLAEPSATQMCLAPLRIAQNPWLLPVGCRDNQDLLSWLFIALKLEDAKWSFLIKVV